MKPQSANTDWGFFCEGSIASGSFNGDICVTIHAFNVNLARLISVDIIAVLLGVIYIGGNTAAQTVGLHPEAGSCG